MRYDVEGDVLRAVAALAGERGASANYDETEGLISWGPGDPPSERDVADKVAELAEAPPPKSIEERVEALEEAEATRT